MQMNNVLHSRITINLTGCNPQQNPIEIMCTTKNTSWNCWIKSDLLITEYIYLAQMKKCRYAWLLLLNLWGKIAQVPIEAFLRILKNPALFRVNRIAVIFLKHTQSLGGCSRWALDFVIPFVPLKLIDNVSFCQGETQKDREREKEARKAIESDRENRWKMTKRRGGGCWGWHQTKWETMAKMRAAHTP